MEAESVMAVIPYSNLKTWGPGIPAMAGICIKLVSSRFTDVITTVNEVAFRRVDERLVSYLREHSVENRIISITHQELAADLGSTCEMISLSIKDFERKDLIQLARGQIRVVNLDK